MENKNKTQYLCLENWVHAVMRPEQLLLYNTLTGQSIISDKEQHRAIVAAMHERHNLGVIAFEPTWAEDIAISQFIEEAIAKNIFSIEETPTGELKPIRLMPVLNIQKNVERLKQESDRSAGEMSLSYLTELTLYVNDFCSLNCSHCGQSHKQFICCSKGTNGSILDTSVLTKIVAQIKHAPILKLNIIGGDIFSYPLLNEIPEIFNAQKEKIHFWTHYKNFRVPIRHCGLDPQSPENGTMLKQVQHDDAIHKETIWDIVVDFPVDEQVLSACVSANVKEKTQYRYHFIVQNEEEVNLVEKMTTDYEIQDFEMHPYYNGENIDFFKTCIFLNKEDILGSTVSQRRIFCNQALNSNFFGSLTVLPSGDVVANLNAPVLENIATTPVLTLITKELEQNTAWRKTRNEYPCNACLFQYLCPPISNYEMTFQRENLCTLYENT